MKLIPQPIFDNNALCLRAMIDTDAPALSRLRSNLEVNKYLGREASTSVEQALAFIHKINEQIGHAQYYWAMDLGHGLIGSICLWNIDIHTSKVELGYELLPEYQGQGLMTQACTTIIDFAKNKIQCQKVTADVHALNVRSIHLLDRLGFLPQTPSAKDIEENMLPFLLTF